MKFLALFFALGFALTTAVPFHSISNDLEVERAIEDTFSGVRFEAEKGLSLDEVKRLLKERFDEILKKVKDAVEAGKGFKEDAINKLKELREKLAQLGEKTENKTKTFFDNLREKGREFLKKLFDKMGVDEDEVDEHAEKILLAAEADFDVEKLKEKFNELVNKVKDAFEQGKNYKDALEKLQNIRETLKFLNIDLGEKGKEYLEILKQKVKDYWNKLLEKLGSKRSADIDIFGMLEELKQKIKEKFDPEKLKEFVKKVFDKRNELRDQLFDLLREKGEKRKQKILDFIDRVLGDKETQSSISDEYEKIKEYFKGLNIELKERFTKFGKWVKNEYEKGLEKGKTKAENVRKIAKEFLEDTRQISKEVAHNALFFFREYKKDLGSVWDDLVVKVRDIFGRDRALSQHSIKETFEKVKQFFKKLQIDLKDKYIKFGEWVRNQYEKGLEIANSRIENVKNIAKEVLKEIKDIGKEAAAEALEFFQDHKDDMGTLYVYVKQKLREILSSE